MEFTVEGYGPNLQGLGLTFRRFLKAWLAISLTLIAFAGPNLFGTPANLVSAAGNIQSVQDGDWSNPATWDLNRVPGAGDTVTVNDGDVVVYNVVSDDILGEVAVEGTLRFSRAVNTRLKTNDNILVLGDGYLDMGTPSDYIPQNTKAEVIWVLTQQQANNFVGGPTFQQTDKGLWVISGRWDVHGAPLLRTWSKIVVDADSGTNVAIVENNVTDWPIGGSVVLTPTEEGTSDGELRSIVALESVAGGGTKIILDTPLASKHSGTAPFQGEVALLTRNVLFTTDLLGRSDADYISDTRTRQFAHTIYMKGTRGDIQYAQFKYMGHQGKLARYATHHHRMLDTSAGMVVRGTSGWLNGFRCVNLHITHSVLVEDNVCYRTSASNFFIEMEHNLGYNFDNVFAHNIAIDSRNIDGAFQSEFSEDFWRAAGFWVGSGTNHEVFLGNVSSGAGGPDGSTGYYLKGNAPPDGGAVPFTFVANTAHNNSIYGFYTWQNSIPARDVVGIRMWRNGDSGIRWGAYHSPYKVYDAELLENGINGLDVTSVRTFVQDSLITGSTSGNTNSEIGFNLRAYILEQPPGEPVWIVRNTFKDLNTEGIHQTQVTCSDPNVKNRPILEGNCSAFYTHQMGNTFDNVSQGISFGLQPNPNSFARIFDHQGEIKDAQGVTQNIQDFVLIRKDLVQNTSEQGVITEKLITNDSFYSPQVDALVTPMTSLPPTIDYTGLLNRRGNLFDFTFNSQRDYPPEITLDMSLNGRVATLTANSTDDNSVSRVEFFVDWLHVGTVTNPGPQSEIKVDLGNLPCSETIASRKYAYIYARAFDGTRQLGSYEQRAYSDVIEIGPEELLANHPAPLSPVNDNIVSNLRVANGNCYHFIADGLVPGAPIYLDRDYSFVGVPGMVSGADYIMTANNDKNEGGSDFITFSINEDATVHVAYDGRANSLPDWLSDWHDTGETISVAGEDHNLFSKDFTAGPVALGGNIATGASGVGSNYSVFVVGLGSSSTPPPTPNLAPVVNAGADQNVTMPNSASLDGTVTDDNLPGGSLTVTWSKQSGPGNVTFGDSSAVDTTASFSTDGTYVLKLEADDSQLTGSDSMTVVVNPAPPVNQTPRVYAPDTSGNPGDIMSVPILISHAPEGVAGFTLEITLANGSVSQIVSANLGNDFATFNTSQDVITASRVLISGVDANNRVQTGATDITLLLLDIEGMTDGSTDVQIDVVALDDDNGNPIGADVNAGTLTVIASQTVCPTLPGATSSAQDLDGDGTCEDLNGNGRLDFADIVDFFDLKDSAEIQSNVLRFDFNGNSVVDMDDIAELFFKMVNSIP